MNTKQLSIEDYKTIICGLRAVEALIDNSIGVAGLHLNEEDAPWDDLRTGGQFEDWLIEFDDALDTLEHF